MTIDLENRFFHPLEANWGSPFDVQSAVSSLRKTFDLDDSSGLLCKLLKGHGMIESKSGVPTRVRKRLIPRWASLMEVWVDTRWKRLPDDCCRIYYNHPRSCPGFTVLAYACSGRCTSLATLRAGLTILEEIAILVGNRAIVCQLTNPRLDSRILRYFGYVQHVPHLNGNHYIRRLDQQFTDKRF